MAGGKRGGKGGVKRGKSCKRQTVDEYMPKGSRNDKRPAQFQLAFRPGVDSFLCGLELRIQGRLDLEAAQFAKFTCLVCGEPYQSVRDRRRHNDEFHADDDGVECDICVHVVDSLALHSIPYHAQLQSPLEAAAAGNVGAGEAGVGGEAGEAAGEAAGEVAGEAAGEAGEGAGAVV